MGSRKRTEITVETREVLIIRQGGFSIAWCAGCGKKVRIICLSGGDLKSLSPEPIGRKTIVSQLHFIEIADGSLGICLPSLLKRVSVQDLPLRYRKEIP
jgi:hypothetical protein